MELKMSFDPEMLFRELDLLDHTTGAPIERETRKMVVGSGPNGTARSFSGNAHYHPPSSSHPSHGPNSGGGASAAGSAVLTSLQEAAGKNPILDLIRTVAMTIATNPVARQMNPLLSSAVRDRLEPIADALADLLDTTDLTSFSMLSYLIYSKSIESPHQCSVNCRLCFLVMQRIPDEQKRAFLKQHLWELISVLAFTPVKRTRQQNRRYRAARRSNMLFLGHLYLESVLTDVEIFTQLDTMFERIKGSNCKVERTFNLEQCCRLILVIWKHADSRNLVNSVDRALLELLPLAARTSQAMFVTVSNLICFREALYWSAKSTTTTTTTTSSSSSSSAAATSSSASTLQRSGSSGEVPRPAPPAAPPPRPASAEFDMDFYGIDNDDDDDEGEEGDDDHEGSGENYVDPSASALTSSFSAPTQPQISTSSVPRSSAQQQQQSFASFLQSAEPWLQLISKETLTPPMVAAPAPAPVSMVSSSSTIGNSTGPDLGGGSWQGLSLKT